MPHVKGNKFKPKTEEQEVPKQKKRRVQVDAANLPAAATATVSGRGKHPQPRKKQKRASQGLEVQQRATIVEPVAASGKAGQCNWAALRPALDKPRGPRRRASTSGGEAQQESPPPNLALTKVVAIDCEMVGVGPGGERSALARVCIVNSHGNVIMDSWCRPKEAVTDFRTRVSGVRPCNLRGAPLFEEVFKDVQRLLQGRIIVGHALENDLQALELLCHRSTIRDTAKFPPLMQAQGRTGKLKPRALRHLAAEQLGLTIQQGEHSPVEDARAALYLYLKHRKDWEKGRQ